MTSETLTRSLKGNALWEKYRPIIDREACIDCGRCVKECSFGALAAEDAQVRYVGGCVACGRCAALCPTGAIDIREVGLHLPKHACFTERDRKVIIAQARSGGVLLSSCGTDLPYRSIFDDLLLDAAQVTNPSIDPLREPIETKTYLGRRSGRLSVENRNGKFELASGDGVIVSTDMPIMVGHISLGSVSYNTQKALFMAARDLNIVAGSGEGGLHPDFYHFAGRINSEVASGGFGVTPEYLKRVAAVEIKIGQGAKPGHGGHLPGEKVTELISETRMIPLGTDALSPYPHHDIYSIEDLQQLISVLKEATDYAVPVGVKVAAVHNIGATASLPNLIIRVIGTPGNNLGALLNGSTIEVFGNRQDLTGNTMNSSRILVHGGVSDVTGLAARGGEILIRGSAGYRTGIHMKEFKGTGPTIIIGGRAGDYLGEYMAGGTILVLGIDIIDRPIIGQHIGAGMHGGRMFVMGKVSPMQLAPGAKVSDIEEEDREAIEKLITSYELAFGITVERRWGEMKRITPSSSRPFGAYYDNSMI